MTDSTGHEEVQTDKVGPIIDSSDIKPKLASEQTNASDLKRYLILLFGTYRRAAAVAGMSESRLHQLFIGYKIPASPDIIRRIANAWNVDVIILTKIFEQLERGRK